MPQSVKNKMAPEQLARLQLAEEEALKKRQEAQPATMVAQTYQAPLPPVATGVTEGEKQQLFKLAKRRAMERDLMEKYEEENRTQTTVVQFRGGGWLRAERATPTRRGFEIRVNRALVAQYPRHRVQLVRENAGDWQEPVPTGFVKIKPAKGITVILRRGTSKRITVKKSTYEDI
jgi:hypothetical protein